MERCSRLGFLAGMSTALLFVAVRAQDWQPLAAPMPRRYQAMAYDLARGQLVLCGGSDGLWTMQETWALGLDGWRLRSQWSEGPPSRHRTALAYDWMRGRCVLFGGDESPIPTGSLLDDTWEFGGVRWKQVMTTPRPAARAGHAMAFDGAQQVTVLFGGSAHLTSFDDTWLFDGLAWRACDPLHAPTPRFGHAMAHDLARARTVLFGGRDASGCRGDTWEWDGHDWHEVQTSNAPPPRFEHALAHDLIRSQTVLFGGADGSSVYGDTWEFDGSHWRQAQPSVAPSSRYGHSCAFDLLRSAVVLCSGQHDSNAPSPLTADTWTWDGTNWTEVATPSSKPRHVDFVAAFDSARDRVVGVSSHDVPWELSGAGWLRRMVSPFGASDGAAAFDRERARTLVFGGGRFFHVDDATSSFDGTRWQTLQPRRSPPARAYAAMAWDAARREAVLFGGQDGAWYGDALGDTWLFDGVEWREAFTILAPAPRARMAMCYDSGRDRTVLHGGVTGYVGSSWFTSTFDDTWVFDGTQWSPLPTNAGPGAHATHAMAYDPVRGAVILVGDGAPTWRLDGATWSRLHLPHEPRYVSSGAMVYDDIRARLVLVDNGAGLTWFLPAPDAASFARHGRGCAGSAGTPSLDASPGAVPSLGASFGFDLTALPSQPGVALLVFGFDLVHWNGSLLPADLTAQGLPGCDLWLAPASALALSHGAGSLHSTWAIPNQLALRGAIFGVQALVLDRAAANGIGATSNGAILRLW